MITDLWPYFAGFGFIAALFFKFRGVAVLAGNLFAAAFGGSGDHRPCRIGHMALDFRHCTYGLAHNWRDCTSGSIRGMAGKTGHLGSHERANAVQRGRRLTIQSTRTGDVRSWPIAEPARQSLSTASWAIQSRCYSASPIIMKAFQQ